MELHPISSLSGDQETWWLPPDSVCKISEWKLQAVAGSRARKGDFVTDQGVDDFMVEIEISKS